MNATTTATHKQSLCQIQGISDAILTPLQRQVLDEYRRGGSPAVMWDRAAGKTFLLACIAAEAVVAGRDVFFFTCTYPMLKRALGDIKEVLGIRYRLEPSRTMTGPDVKMCFDGATIHFKMYPSHSIFASSGRTGAVYLCDEYWVWLKSRSREACESDNMDREFNQTVAVGSDDRLAGFTRVFAPHKPGVAYCGDATRLDSFRQSLKAEVATMQPQRPKSTEELLAELGESLGGRTAGQFMVTEENFLFSTGRRTCLSGPHKGSVIHDSPVGLADSAFEEDIKRGGADDPQPDVIR